MYAARAVKRFGQLTSHFTHAEKKVRLRGLTFFWLNVSVNLTDTFNQTSFILTVPDSA